MVLIKEHIKKAVEVNTSYSIVKRIKDEMIPKQEASKNIKVSFFK